METPLPTRDVCSTCGEPLNAGNRCLVCLLRGALPETVTPEMLPASGYGDFEVARREDGSAWELGRGAMGVTYKAVDRVLHRAVALKVIQFGADGPAREALRERFLREARAAATLRHANVAGVFQFGTSDEAGRCYLAMELVEGETLAARVRREGPLDVATALEVARQVALALVAAANRGVIHRDLKPGNLMLKGGDGPTDGLEVKVIDFGLAKMTAATAGEADLTNGGFVGTPAFASPEQAARHPVDERSDLYSLGVTLWYALTGSVPFAGCTPAEGGDHPDREHLPDGQLAARGVPRCVIALVRRLLAVSPDGRYASAKELVRALDACRARLPAGKPWAAARRRLALAALALLAAAGGGWWWTRVPASREGRAMATPTVPVPEKSLAVLPFDNFSEDKDSAFFADGVQDEVLADLARVADLKVISRTSVMPYKDPARRGNLREIARTLGVAYVVEGSVQRAGNRIRVSATLIDARSDAHRWAQRYERDLSDVFALQSEIAQSIADALRANVSPAEKAAIAERPTASLAAFALYTEAQGIFVWNDSRGADKALARKAELLHEAVQADPGFALAYCLLAKVECDSEIGSWNGTHVALAKEAAETALRLRPNLGEAHRELARCHLRAGEWDRAREEVAEAHRRLPNDAEALRVAAESDACQGRWESGLANMQKALDLDPKNGEVAQYLICICRNLHRYREWEQTLKKSAANHGLDDEWITVLRAEMERDMGDLAAARTDIAKVPMDFDPTEEVSLTRYSITLYQRDYDAAEQALTAASIEREDGVFFGHPPGSWANGMIARFRGDETKAQAVFAAARKRLDADWNEEPVNKLFLRHFLASASLLDAGLGRKEEAIREARQAVELVTVSQRATGSSAYMWTLRNLALVYARTGELDLAVGQLEVIAKVPRGPAYGELRYDPSWDPLRGNARFKTLVASLAPKR